MRGRRWRPLSSSYSPDGYALLFSEVDREFVTQFIERNLGPVRDFDRTRGTALLDTLGAWFGADGSPSATAERLFVHVNTVYQRLDRLDSVLGTGWRRGDRALELRLALRLAELPGGVRRGVLTPRPAPSDPRTRPLTSDGWSWHGRSPAVRLRHLRHIRHVQHLHSTKSRLVSGEQE
ncbi:PucR family transcriptional regulator [Dietzia sp. SLG510A3-30A2]|nr:PucR family transcriptional regulator [Dietzia sp. SLG510A3-30A2]